MVILVTEFTGIAGEMRKYAAHLDKRSLCWEVFCEKEDMLLDVAAIPFYAYCVQRCFFNHK